MKLQNSLMVSMLFLAMSFLVFPVSQVHAQASYGNPLTGNCDGGAGKTSDFGLRNHPIHKVDKPHNGADYGCTIGQNINIPSGCTNGQVRTNPGGYGTYLDVDCGNGIKMRYAHLSSATGGASPTAKCGNTGGSTGAHLHYEISVNGQRIDPIAAECLDLTDSKTLECLADHAEFALDSTANRGGAEQGNCKAGNNNFPPTGVGTPSTPTTPTLPIGTNLIVPNKTNNIGKNMQGRIQYQQGGKLTSRACDISVFNIMRGLGSFHAQEDMATAQILVSRPDSVIEYTCSDQFVGFTEDVAGPIFSNTNDWVFQLVPHSIILNGFVLMSVSFDSKSLEMVLESTVTETLGNYVSEQFPAKFLSDTSSLDYKPSGSVPGASYTCSYMSQVWQEAKCTNFGDTKHFGSDGPFLTFNEMITRDPRTHAQTCSNAGLLLEDVERIRNEMFAYNGLYPAFFNENLTSPAEYREFINAEFDAIFTLADGTKKGTYTPYMTEYKQPGRCDLVPPIPTGIQVVKSKNLDGAGGGSVEEYDEYFCATPSCYYVPAGTAKGECAATGSPSGPSGSTGPTPIPLP